MKNIKESRILPWWVYVIVVIVIIIILTYELMLPSDAKIDLTFKIMAAMFAIIAIYLTVRRMNQTQKQIDVMSDNNKFNNFYRHKDIFNESLRKTEIIVIIGKYADMSISQLLNIYYRFFFETDYKEFVAKISSKGKKHIDRFIESLRNSKINTVPIFKSDNIDQIIIEFYDNMKNFIGLYIASASDNILKRDNKWKDMIENSNETIELMAVRQLLDIYFSYYIIFETLEFDGKEKLQKYACLTFTHNIARIIQHSNLSEILLPSLKWLND